MIVVVSLFGLLSPLLVAVSNAQQFDPISCGQFDFHQYSNPIDAMTALKPAMLRLEVDGVSGTGFLIDVTRGYVLTAGHVITNAKPNANGGQSPSEIIGAFSFAQQKKLKLTYVDDDTGNDVAIIKLESPAAAKGLSPFELTVNSPPEDTRVALGGFQIGDNFVVLTSGETSITDVKARNFQVRTNTFGGDSGSPVVDQRGLVVGIVTNKREGGMLAVASPTLAFWKMLLKLPPSTLSTDLARKILEGNISEDFVDQFRARTPIHITNLNILELMKALKDTGQSNLNASARNLIACPVHIAATQRELTFPATELINRMLPQWASVLAGRAFIVSGVIQSRLEEKSVAVAQFASAETLFSNEILEVTQPLHGSCVGTPDWPSPVKSKSEFLQKVGIADVSNQAPSSSQACFDLPSKAYLAALVGDLNSSRLSRISVKPTTINDSELTSIKTSSAIAALMSNDLKAYSKNLDNIGDASQLANDFSTAKAAYATSWKNGNKSSEVLTKFRSSAIESQKKLSNDPDVAIEFSKTLSTSDLKILAK